MIEVQGLTKRYGAQVGVEEISFSVREGEIVGFLGPNGAGKTTTMRVLTGFLQPTAGSVRVAGHDVVTSSLAARAALGYLPESAALYPELRVREYLSYRARLEGIRGPEVRRRVDAAISRCLLEDVAHRKVDNLSKGYRQRTALAGALVHEPPVLVLDEPTVGLDPMQIIKIREMIRDLGRERAVLLSTHILPEVDAVCDRVLIIDRGRIVAEGAPQELRRRLAATSFLRVELRGRVDAVADLQGVPGVVSAEVSESEEVTRARVQCASGEDPSEAIFRLAVAKGWVLRELAREALSLEDVFVRLTRQEPSVAAVPPEEATAAPTPGEPS
jgi:ABC-2 type transport system ATP-binding protein